MTRTTLTLMATAALAGLLAAGSVNATTTCINYMEHPGRIAEIDFPSARQGAGTGVSFRGDDPVARGTATKGNMTYVAYGPDGLVINPIGGAEPGTYDGDAFSVAASDDPNCVWIGVFGGIRPLDVSDPSNPLPGPVIAIPGAGTIIKLSMSGSTLVAQDEAGNAFRVRLSAPCGTLSAIDQIANASEGSIAMDMYGDTAAFVGPGVLVISDLSTTPVTSAFLTVPGGGDRDVAVTQDESVVVANDMALHKYSTDPIMPVGQNTDLVDVQKVVRGSNMTIVAKRPASLNLLDDDVLQQLAVLRAATNGTHVAADGAIAMLRQGSNAGITVYRFGNGMSPGVLQRLSNNHIVPNGLSRDSFGMVLVSDSGGMSGGRVRVFDGANPANLVHRGDVDAPAVQDLNLFKMPFERRTAGDPPELSLAAAGSLADFELIDYTDPTSPQVIGTIAASSSQVATSPDGSVVLRSSASPLGFYLVDVTDPTTPFDRGFVSTPNAVNDALVDGNFAVIATTAQTGRWDVTDQDAPVLDHVTSLTGVQAVASSSVADQYYLGGTVGADRRIARYDFGTQTELSSVSVGARSLSVVTSGGSEIVYAGDAVGTVFVIDWTDPTDPLLLGEYTEDGLTMKTVAASDETVIVTNGSFPGDVIVLPAQQTGVTVSTPVGFEPVVPLFGRSWPNPFRSSTTFEFTLTRGSEVRMDVFDVTGRRVRELAARAFTAGEHAVRWDGRDAGGAELSSGVYFVRLEASGQVDRRKVKLLR